MRDQNKKSHDSKLKNIKGLVDHKPPKTLNHRIAGGKKIYLDKMRQSDERTANLSLMVKFDNIQARNSLFEGDMKINTPRKPKLHDFTE
mmetsp:Transcript_65397/g.55485  ORF Transcript_65397/g.55485 Transcript_65397/m.55485 type:complete len:89 (+) Transcript_65397:48-314(+)